MKIAVVGSGIAGLSAAWLLARSGHAISLFEAGHRAGGHSNTIDVTLDGIRAGVDTGFLVHNDHTYPNLTRLLALLDVPVYQTEMTFSVSLQRENLEWAGSNLASLFAQKRNLLRPTFWQMLGDILRLHRQAPQLQCEAAASQETLGQILSRHGYGEAMRSWYLLPMAAAIWSGSTRDMAAFPAQTFFDFCMNHGLLQIFDRPQWKTIKGGSKVYVERMLRAIADVRLANPVRQISRPGNGVIVHDDHGQHHFDKLILACHSDQSLALLQDPSPREAAVLGKVRYQPNQAYLHTDQSFLPTRKQAWAAWNYQMAQAGESERPVMVTYLLNRLQDLPFSSPLMVTLNPERVPEDILASFDYAHPVFDSAAIAAQKALPALQGERNTWFAGAWTRYGFHEDGLLSGMQVAQALGARIPWDCSLPLGEHRPLPEFVLATR